jgi:drug/metabolite transporter (DMT)-like permease
MFHEVMVAEVRRLSWPTMLAVVGGLGAAFAWATTVICAARATRLIGVPSVLAWVMLTGLVVTLPWAASQGVPDVDTTATLWLTVAGVGNCAGLLLVYSGLRIGKVGVVAPIVSTEGAIAALIAVLAGEELAPGAGAALVVVAAGIVLVGMSQDSSGSSRRTHDLRAALFAGAAALSFGASLYATGHVASDLPVSWAILPPRVIGVIAIAVPLTLTARLRLTRNALPMVLVAGVAEVVGFASFALGARHGIAVSAVLASEFGAVAALAAFVLFRERVVRLQMVGIAAIAVGVAVLSALQA